MRRFILTLLFVVGVHTALAQEEGLDISPALREQMNQIEDQTSDIRELEAESEVPRRFPTRDQLVDYLTELFDEELPPEVAQRELLFYVAFDLLSRDVDLRQVYLNLYSQQVAGFYDSEDKVMNVILISGERPEDELPLLEEIVYSHEYVHVLQDAHFDLEGLLTALESDPENTDGSLALLSLIEGDATLAMSQYMYDIAQENPTGTLLELLLQGAQAGALDIPEGTPPIIEDELLYPYEAGMQFVTTLYNEGGWQQVNEAYSAPPRSTEHIFHPERYIAGDMPQEVRLAEPMLGGDWQLVFERTLGEFYLRQYLDTQLGRSRVAEAGSGWGGDRYRLYEHVGTGDLAWVLRLAWDTLADAAEFHAAYGDFVAARLDAPVEGAPCWADADEVICFVADEPFVTVTYAPSLDLATDLLENQGG